MLEVPSLLWQRYQELAPILEKISECSKVIEADVPEKIWNAISDIYTERPFKSVVFDLSGASSTFIFTVIGALSQICPDHLRSS